MIPQISELFLEAHKDFMARMYEIRAHLDKTLQSDQDTVLELLNQDWKSLVDETLAVLSLECLDPVLRRITPEEAMHSQLQVLLLWIAIHHGKDFIEI